MTELPAFTPGRRVCTGALLALLLLTLAASAEQPSRPATAPIPLQGILDGMSQKEAARAMDLKQYTSTRTYQLHNLRFRKTAQMVVKVTYRAPGHKEFEVLSESGPHAVCERVLRRMIESEAEASRDQQRRLNQITAENYDFEFLRMEREEGRDAYVLRAAPKSKSKYLIRGEVWVDTADLAISKITGQPARNPSFWIRDSRLVYRYRKFESVWLPVSMESEADALIFGRTEVKVNYQDYKISTETLENADRSLPAGMATGRPIPESRED